MTKYNVARLPTDNTNLLFTVVEKSLWNINISIYISKGAIFLYAYYFKKDVPYYFIEETDVAIHCI